MSTAVRRVEVQVRGIVQGVGFRPFVCTTATELGLVGWVRNDGSGVRIEVQGAMDAIDRFLDALRSKAPPLAVVLQLRTQQLQPVDDRAFDITQSDAQGDATTGICPDIATCDACLRELRDPNDRRHRYPFINCTHCGPRFTIVWGVPYDRSRTTMAAFEMCEDCRREYEDPADRRFHAQPVACPACGPTLTFDGDGHHRGEAALAAAAAALRGGLIVAIKGLGGYHLAVDARHEPAVATLRSRKHREQKPFAVLASTLDGARRLGRVGPVEAAQLTGPRSPIVLLERLPGADVAASVAPANRHLGVMLPYTPLHHLLMDALDFPIVLTSGNVSDEPIAFADDDARGRLAPIADAFLGHDRPIHTRIDDSVIRVFRGSPMLLRRSRGWAPQPIVLGRDVPRAVLACGGELKNTVCVAKGPLAFMSQHVGDLESYAAFRSFTDTVDHLVHVFDVRPQVVAHDLHPEYLSTKWALERDDIPLVGVQHHHAHVVSCLADNGHPGPAIGVAFDGLGYGADGTLWGGEFLVADFTRFERMGHLSVTPMPGGAAAIREPWRMAAAHLHAALGDDAADLAVRQRNAARWDAVTELAQRRISAPLTSSVGRLFDAVASLVGVRDDVAYEGQAAIELEQIADRSERGSYPVAFSDTSTPWRIDGPALVRAVVHDIRHGRSRSTVATRFHHAIADAIVLGCRRIRDERDLSTVALTGGVFQNVLLLAAAIDRLESAGFGVLVHRQIPCNDGGLSLGQAMIAAVSVE